MEKEFERKTRTLNGQRVDVIVPAKRISLEEGIKQIKEILRKSISAS